MLKVSGLCHEEKLHIMGIAMQEAVRNGCTHSVVTCWVGPFGEVNTKVSTFSEAFDAEQWANVEAETRARTGCLPWVVYKDGLQYKADLAE